MRMRVDICVKCIEGYRGGSLTPRDKELLKERTIICPEHDGEEPLKGPPETCPWKLEHLMDSKTKNGSDYWVDVWYEQTGNGLYIPT